jgi:protein gp37
MKLENSIGWCDETTNAVTGCDKVSLGCKNCYAQVGTRARVLRAQGVETWGPNGVRHPVASFPDTVRRLNKKCICDKCHVVHKWPIAATLGQCCCTACGGRLRRIRLFADSNSDWLDPKWPIDTLETFLGAILLSPNVDVLLLTKRIELFPQRMADLSWNVMEADFDCWLEDWIHNQKPPTNIWLGVSLEDQPRADDRIPKLIQMPAAIRMLSVEPLLEPVNLHLSRHADNGGMAHHGSVDSFGQPQQQSANLRNVTIEGKASGSHSSATGAIDWVIVGGESGRNRRDCGVEAIISVAEQCRAAGVPVYVKQDVALRPGQQGRIPGDIWALKQFPEQRVAAAL